MATSARNDIYSGSEWMTEGGVYPGDGDSIGLAGTSPSEAEGIVDGGGSAYYGGASHEHAPHGADGANDVPAGSPIVGFIIAMGFLFLVLFLFHRFGKDTDRIIPPTVISAFMVGLFGLVTIPAWKTLTAALANWDLPFAAELHTYTNAA